MIEGVVKGYSKELEINGVGFRAAKQGKQLVLNVGYSHQVFVDERDQLKIDVPAPNKVIVSGPDKQAVGQLAAEIRRIRPPEPYLGKGIKYATEVIRHKEGKTAAKKK
jgi:large subunit ribosomal protein L6